MFCREKTRYCVGVTTKYSSALVETKKRLGFLSPLYRRSLRTEHSLHELVRPVLLNSIIAEMARPVTYLEIGLNRGRTFDSIIATRKVGVDPRFGFQVRTLSSNMEVHKLPSDVFFENYRGGHFDLVFIDGLHSYEQVHRDFLNSLAILNPGGVIVIDDTVPLNDISALPDMVRAQRSYRASGQNGGPWFGDVYRVIPDIAGVAGLDYATVKVNGHGMTMVWRLRDVSRQPAEASNHDPNLLSRPAVGESDSEKPHYLQVDYRFMNLASAVGRAVKGV